MFLQRESKKRDCFTKKPGEDKNEYIASYAETSNYFTFDNEQKLTFFSKQF